MKNVILLLFLTSINVSFLFSQDSSSVKDIRQYKDTNRVYISANIGHAFPGNMRAGLKPNRDPEYGWKSGLLYGGNIGYMVNRTWHVAIHGEVNHFYYELDPKTYAIYEGGDYYWRSIIVQLQHGKISNDNGIFRNVGYSFVGLGIASIVREELKRTDYYTGEVDIMNEMREIVPVVNMGLGGHLTFSDHFRMQFEILINIRCDGPITYSMFRQSIGLSYFF